EFYERAGLLKNSAGDVGSLTMGGAVSPAGGNFEEPVTQSTLAVVGCFLGLSRERSNARRYPSIDPLISWSKYLDRFRESGDEMTRKKVEIVIKAQNILQQGDEIGKKMSVVGEEGISIDDYVVYLKGEFYDSVLLQQNAFDVVDTTTDANRQYEIAELVDLVLSKEFNFDSRDEARRFFVGLSDDMIQWNYTPKGDDGYKKQKDAIIDKINNAE
ncbi:MAG: V-type ATP synthase subunit A, partial [Spirochaetota bacterium]